MQSASNILIANRRFIALYILQFAFYILVFTECYSFITIIHENKSYQAKTSFFKRTAFDRIYVPIDHCSQ
jgi:hypothetical protein